MINPIFWLVLSFLLVSVSLTAVLVVLIPAVVELSRAARSFEKLCDTLDRDLPPTLESIRQTTTEIAHLTDDVNAGVQNAGRVAQQVDQSVSTVRSQAQRAQVGTRSLMAGMGAAWATLTQPEKPSDRPRHHPTKPRRPATHRATSSSSSPGPLAPASARAASPVESSQPPAPVKSAPESTAHHSRDRTSNPDIDPPAPSTSVLDQNSTPESRTPPETSQDKT